jgi:hypothetical protein
MNLAASSWDVCPFPNPMLTAFLDLVDSYDDETNQVSWVAIRAARDVIAGRIPAHWNAS